MPYIKQADRAFILEDNERNQQTIILNEIKSAGDIQYAIALITKAYLSNSHYSPNYQKLNDVMGALSGAQMEFYRRTVAPYEDEKIEENGDI